jgi:hypothetical protein
MSDYRLPFNLDACGKIDEFASLACQPYNLGDKGEWFGCLRAGFLGLHARVYGVALHFYEVHAWRLKQRTRTETEYHLSSIFFNMDSALECFIFALNGLGYGAAPQEFLDVTDDKALRRVAPWNITGDKSRSPLAGYAKYFSALQAHWQAHLNLLEVIMEQHDVSKHRSRIYVGGRHRDDPPPGFYEQIGITADSPHRYRFAPKAEIVLMPRPKTPPSKHNPPENYGDLDTLENIAERFCEFISVSAIKAHEDAVNNITFPHKEYLPYGGFVYRANVDLYEDAECTKKREDVTGVMLATEIIGYGVTNISIAPTSRFSYYREGKRIVRGADSRSLEKVWGETWYIDPDDGQKKFAWQSSSEFVAEQIDS